MSFQHKKKYDPTELHWIEVKFNRLKYSILRKHRYNHNHQSDNDKKLETDGIHLIKNIEDYGFKFFAAHYLNDKMIELEALARQMR